MLCDICGKNEATVHLTEIVDNNMTKLHLCEDCARKKGAEMESHFGLSDLLAGLADFEAKIAPKKELKMKCPKCNLSYDDFKNTGRLGCGECYATFEKTLVPLIKRIHGSSVHTGKSFAKAEKAVAKTPVKKKKAELLEELQARLQRAIKLEEFEEAARLRDKIREVEREQ